MQELRTSAQEAAEDIFFGQVVIVWARWFVILAATILVLWSATTASQLTTAILLVIALMAINFFVHGRYLMERPANRIFLQAMSLLDLVVISAIVAFWQGTGGLSSPFYIFYFPMLLAFAFVFTPRATVTYTVLTVATYVATCLAVNASFVGNVGDVKSLIMRLVALVAMGGLGTYYWRIQRERRREALSGSPVMADGHR